MTQSPPERANECQGAIRVPDWPASHVYSRTGCRGFLPAQLDFFSSKRKCVTSRNQRQTVYLWASQCNEKISSAQSDDRVGRRGEAALKIDIDKNGRKSLPYRGTRSYELEGLFRLPLVSLSSAPRLPRFSCGGAAPEPSFRRLSSMSFAARAAYALSFSTSTSSLRFPSMTQNVPTHCPSTLMGAPE